MRTSESYVFLEESYVDVLSEWLDRRMYPVIYYRSMGSALEMTVCILVALPNDGSIPHTFNHRNPLWLVRLRTEPTWTHDSIYGEKDVHM